jgi:hypothetical protein
MVREWGKEQGFVTCYHQDQLFFLHFSQVMYGLKIRNRYGTSGKEPVFCAYGAETRLMIITVEKATPSPSNVKFLRFLYYNNKVIDNVLQPTYLQFTLTINYEKYPPWFFIMSAGTKVK